MEADPVEDYIQKQPESKRTLLFALRDLIKETAPELSESLKWGQPCYGANSNVCYLATQTNHINFGFFNGSQLPDPEKLLEGTGAQMRHIKVRNEADIKEKPFQEIIKAGFALQNK